MGILVPDRRPDGEAALSDSALRPRRRRRRAGVLVRADLNVPLEDGRVADDTRIVAALPTLELLLEHGAAEVAVCSHLGRPKGEDPAYAIVPVASPAPTPRTSGSYVLENTRFDPGETKNDPAFARHLAEGRDLYVNDAFGSAHRAHASTVGVASCCRLRGAAALAELEHLGRLLGDVERPFVLVAGGAKVEDKLGVLENLGGRADTVIVGGKMAEELRDENPLPFEVVLPTDVVAAARSRRTRRRGGAVRRAAGRLARAGHRAGDAGATSRARIRERDGLLERADGGLRVGALRRGHEGRRGGGGRRRRLHGRRRRRLGAGGAGARPGRADLLGLDRRRRLARAAGGQGASGVAAIPVAAIAENYGCSSRQLEDVQGAGDVDACFDDFDAPTGVDVIVCPPFVSLATAVESGHTVYAQNVHWEASGAYTGEIAPAMLLELGVQGALVGHSERRQLFGETDEMVARRARAALARGSGDRLRRRDAGAARVAATRSSSSRSRSRRSPSQRRARDLVTRLRAGLGDRHRPDGDPRTGAGDTAFIKGLLDRPVLYGGSVKPENADELLSQADRRRARRRRVARARLPRAICQAASTS